MARPKLSPEVKKAAISIRVPPSLRQQLETVAAENTRSLTQEIVHRLVASFVEEARHAELRALIRAELAQVQS